MFVFVYVCALLCLLCINVYSMDSSDDLIPHHALNRGVNLFQKDMKDILILQDPSLFDYGKKTVAISYDPTMVSSESFDTEQKSNFYQAGLTNFSGSVGGYGFKAEASYEQENKSKAQFKETNHYFVSTIDLPKATVSLNQGTITLTSDFIKALNAAITRGSREALTSVFDNFGTHIPTILTMGGKLSSRLNTHGYESFSSQSLRTAMKASISGSAWGVTAGVKSEMNKNIENSEEYKFVSNNEQRSILGGAQENFKDPERWMASLQSQKNWAVIKYNKVVPFYDYLDIEHKNKLDNTFDGFSKGDGYRNKYSEFMKTFTYQQRASMFK